MKDLTQLVRVSGTLESAMQMMKRMHGEKWDERAKPYRAALQKIMATEGCSVLNAALPVAKVMSDAGESPIMLLAVAADMVNDTFDRLQRVADRETGIPSDFYPKTGG